jgi:serine/threonine protein kinase
MSDNLMKAMECPLTMDIMANPVVASDGRSYDRGALEQWLQEHNTSPITREPISQVVYPNRAMKDIIVEFQCQQPLAIGAELLTLNAPEVLVGSSSFGKVIQGSLQTAGRSVKVAVKFLPGLGRQQQLEHFEKELKVHLVAQTAADGVCRIFGTCEKSNQFCIVMKLYQYNLRVFIDNQPSGKLSVHDVRKITYSLCQTLTQLHKMGVISQDIKPENILMDAYNTPVFADFGISSVVTRTTSIMPTSIKGTFNYMSPEAFRPPLTEKADIWSMACVILEMVSGIAPWYGLQMQQIMMAVAMDKRHPDIPEGTPAEETIRQCFNFDPSERPTAAELGAAFTPEAAPLPEILSGLTQTFAGQIAQLTRDNDKLIKEKEQLQTELQIKDEKLQREAAEMTNLKRQLQNLEVEKNALVLQVESNGV